MTLLGWFNINQTSNAILNSPAANASISFAGLNTFGTGFGLLAIVLVGLIICGLILALLANWDSYKKMKGILGWLARTFDHFLYGILTLILFGIPTGLIYELSKTATSNPGTVSLIGEIIGGLIIAYFVIAGLGYLMKPIFRKIKKNMEREKGANNAKS